MFENLNLYEIQKDFIGKAQKVIESEKIGIFSSPTGTGKTLSLLCSIGTYLSKPSTSYENLSPENKILMKHLFGEEKKACKIFYCSRTHTQLNQAIRELKRVFPHINSVILGSRKIYCLNKDVTTLQDTDLINEKCSELIDENKCCYYNEAEIHTNGILDIEEIKKECNNKKTCSYFYSKKYSKECEIIFLPYNILFSKEGRISAGLEINNSIVIVDEAHNLYETIIQMNTVTITHDMITKYHEAFLKYKNRYEKRMTPNNLEKIKNMINILVKLDDFLKMKYKSSLNSQENEEMCKIPEFLIISDLFNYNLLNLEEYIRESKLTQKLEGFTTNLHFQLYNIIKFLSNLILSDENGRIFYSNRKLRYTTLDPKIYIEDLLVCKSMILAGGTMEPIDSLKKLFVEREIEYYTFSTICNNFICNVLSEGPSKKEIKLNFENRDNDIMLFEIIKCILNLSNAVKNGGVICFIPSKHYINLFKDKIKSFKFNKKIIFDDEYNFNDYKKLLLNENIIFFSVMGGKLSEGINFSDNLCRLLIVIGVPYPTINVELKERMNYHGKNYSTIIAMKTVNQALGRALRHKNDYSAIILIDNRYKSLVQYISPWIAEKISYQNFPKTLFQVNNFLKRYDNNK